MIYILNFDTGEEKEPFYNVAFKTLRKLYHDFCFIAGSSVQISLWGYLGRVFAKQMYFVC